MRIHLAIFAVITLIGCAPEKDERREIATIDCSGGARLRFMEDVRHVSAAPRGWPTFYPYLEYSVGNGPWRRVDQSQKRTPIYTKVYAEADEFIAFDGYLAYPFMDYAAEAPRRLPSVAGVPRARILADLRQGREWDVFVDPAVFARAEYKQLARCLEQNVEKINAALAAHPRPGSNGLMLGQEVPQVVSVVYRRHDYGNQYCGVHSLTPMFRCADDGVTINLDPPNRLELRAPGVDRAGATRMVCTTIGLIADDQREVFVKPPNGGPLRERLQAGALEYYRGCRDTAGKNPFDYFAPAEWQAPPPKPSAPK